MPTAEKEAPPKSTERPGFKRFMHEWEEKLHHSLATNGHEDADEHAHKEPVHKKAA
jgi:hypothetical protein